MRRHMDPDVRLCAHYEFRLGHSVRVARDNLVRAFGADAASIHTLQKWFRKFRSDEERAKKVVVDVMQLKRMIDENPQMKIHELARYFDVSYTTIRRHINLMANVEFGEYTCYKSYRLQRKRVSILAAERNMKSKDETLEVIDVGPVNTKQVTDSKKDEKDDAEECITYFLRFTPLKSNDAGLPDSNAAQSFAADISHHMTFRIIITLCHTLSYDSFYCDSNDVGMFRRSI
ncbi:hypothetical protein GCK32_008572 [Trichostrongylus colubriformis]|uniref:Mos1 transposase HTH domain-containing protein n=1 Tax=Trichostrongylus colubriformis TaxID=6319 RepID=A0AAN8IKY0_TRICO